MVDILKLRKLQKEEPKATKAAKTPPKQKVAAEETPANTPIPENASAGPSIQELLAKKKKEKEQAAAEPHVETVTAPAPPAPVATPLPADAEAMTPEDWASEKVRDEKADSVEKQIKLVTFALDSQRFGIPIDMVQEVVKLQDITRVPNVAFYIIGVINLRGNITPVADLRKRLHLASNALTKNSRIIVLQFDNQAIGFLVDSIADILTMNEGAIQPPPELATNIDSQYIRGVVQTGVKNAAGLEMDESELVILLDLEKIITNVNSGNEH